jgi:beta-1,2-mannobiose phosphorylase / 1,2-beta-oligomannan phosphorylase
MNYLKPKSIEIIAKPENFKPSSDNLKIIGVFNPGITSYDFGEGEETVIMLRVAEVPRREPENRILFPYFNIDNTENSLFDIRFDRFNKEILKNIGKSSAQLPDNTYRLRHISHLRIFRSKNGRSLDEEISRFYPRYEHEKYGVEDPRITKLNGQYLVSYVTVHKDYGVSTCFATTKDFKKFERIPKVEKTPMTNVPIPAITGMKDIAIFNEMVKSNVVNEDNVIGEKLLRYAALIRPNSFFDLSPPGIYISFSPDLIHWGVSERIIKSEEGEFSGTGSPVIKVGDFWIGAYHEGNTTTGEKNFPYKTKLFVLEGENPRKLRVKSNVLIQPNEHKLFPGYRPNVVYTTALINREEEGKEYLDVYSGEDDTYTSVRRYLLEDILKFISESD